MRAFSFGTSRQIGSVLSQIAFLRDMTGWLEKAEAAEALSALLTMLEDRDAFTQDGHGRAGGG
jgi:hypothetical protein